MREIKFRAWDKDKKELFNWSFTQDGLFPADLFNNDNYVVMQYTGLKDKNNKEVYEGDIIEVDGVLAIVVYDIDFAMFNAQIHDGGFLMMAKLDHPRKEIIGNIYENPELLEDNKDGNN